MIGGVRASARQKRNGFVSLWNTTLVGGYGRGDPAGSANDTIVLPLTSDGSYDFVVHWGDGTSDNITGYNQAEVTHQYSSTGIYEVRIGGLISGWDFNEVGDDDKIINIMNFGDLRFTSGNSAVFNKCLHLDVNSEDDLVAPPDSNYMFAQCNLQYNFDPTNWNMSNATGLVAFIQGATVFNGNCGNWDVSNVVSLLATFSSCDAFNNGGSPSISGWDTSNVTDMSSLFNGTIFNQPIGSWNTSNVTNIRGMFKESSIFVPKAPFDQDIGNWDVSNVTDMREVFEYTSFNNGGSPSISGWDVGNVTTFQNMFYRCTGFNQPIGNWNVTGVDTSANDFALMFAGSTSDPMSFNQDISNWDVSNATVFTQMFQYCTGFNQPIGNWTTTNMQYIGSMLSHCSGFDQDLSNWNVSNVTNATNFMAGCTLSTANYDRLLSGWSSQSVNSVTINFGNSRYSSATGAAYRSALVSAGWTITDGGSV